MNFEKLFCEHKIEFDTRINKGWINVNCPYCGSKSTSMHLGFNISNDYCNCWKCGSHNIRDALSKLFYLNKDAVDNLISEYTDNTSVIYRLNNKRLPKAVKIELPNNNFTPREKRYLLSRDFSPRYLNQKYGVVGGGIVGKWKHRIIIPIFVGGKLVSWTARSVLDKEQLDELKIPRYKNLSIEKSVINPKDVLFNIDNCLSNKIVLTEGAFDVFRLGDSFACVLGSSLTENQVKEIRRRYDKVYIMFDNEKEAQDKAVQYGLQLSTVGCDVEVVDAYCEFGVNDGAELNQTQVNVIRKELELF